MTCIALYSYVFDAMAYYLRCGNHNSQPHSSENADIGDVMREGSLVLDPWVDTDQDMVDTDEEKSANVDKSAPGDGSKQPHTGRKHTFFQRSDSTLWLGCIPPPDPFLTPLNEALPVAEKPQLLTPTATRLDLFGPPSKYYNDRRGSAYQLKPSLRVSQENENWPKVSSRHIGEKFHDAFLSRWHLTLELFGRVFVDDVGIEAGSVLSELGGFPVKEVRFRRDMEKLRSSQQRDISFSKMERDRTLLLQHTFRELNQQYTNNSRRSMNGTPPLAVHKVKVIFKDEPGEGSGVARSFYASFAEAVLSNEKIPNLESCQSGSRNLQYSEYFIPSKHLSRVQVVQFWSKDIPAICDGDR